MKKTMFVLMCIAMLSSMVYAGYSEYVEAIKVNHGIIVNGSPVPKAALPRVSIDDKIYVPIRDACWIFGAEIDWDDVNNNAEIKTRDGISDVILNINAETACKVADVLFMEFFGEKFDSTKIEILEYESTYKIMRYEEPILSGDSATITISKRDGSVLNFIMGE